MFRNTKNFLIDSAINAMAVSRDGCQLAVAGRGLLKVYSLEDNSFGNELFSLRSSNQKNLNFSNNDVTWCPLDNDILATAATNGAVVVWRLQQSLKSKIGVVFTDHKRTVNKVCFHSNDPYSLLSGSQDGCMKLFDLRKKEAVTTFVSNSESVRDVQFSPLWTYNFASVQETGNVEIWDIRKPEKPECNFIAHDGPVFACEWHPNQESYKWLATGGRDKTIKVWDLTNKSKPTLVYNVHTITPVSKLKWRPNKDFHIGSCSLVVDFSVYVWDIKRPYVPFAIFGTRKDVTTGFAWKNDPFVFITSCKDGTVYQHRFETDAYYPAEHYPPIGIDFNPFGDIAFSTTDFIYRHSQTLAAANNLYGGNSRKTYKPVVPVSTANGSITPLPGQNIDNTTITSNCTGSNTVSGSTTITGNEIINTKNGRGHSLPIGSPSNHYGNRYFPSISNHVPPPPPPSTTGSSSSSSLASLSGNNNVVNTYNISVPISYKKSNENILADHFRCMISYMMLFLGKYFHREPNSFRDELSTEHFLNSAQKYLLCDRTFEELCEHNASVADSLNRFQIAQTWRIVRHMFSVAGRHPTSSGGGGGERPDRTERGGNNPSGGSIPAPPDGNTPAGLMKTENPSRHTSGGTRHFSGNNNPALMNSAANAPMNVQHYFKDSKDSDDDGEIKHETMDMLHSSLKQDTMPSNKFVVDFFDFQPNMVDGEVEPRHVHYHHGNAMGGNGDDGNLFEHDTENCHDWELQRESIFHRHNISEYSIQMNELNVASAAGETALMNNYDANSSISYDEDDELDLNPSDSPGFFNVNLLALLSSKNLAPPLWSFTESVANTLRFYVDAGDVQTSVSIIVVMGDRMKQITSIDKQTINIWIRSYIDLLHRFRLWNVSTRLMQLSSDSDIQGINQSLTSVSVYCAQCFKPIRHGSILCEKCSSRPSNCVICQVTVRGIYVWCQGCAHGGHLHHLREWFKTNTFCPAGCGHQCEIC